MGGRAVCIPGPIRVDVSDRPSFWIDLSRLGWIGPLDLYGDPLPFRLAYARIERLGVTLDVVRLREAALQKAYASAELERRDERLVVAGDLHDEVLPALFKVHLMGEVLKQDLASGRLLDLDDDLPELLEATSTAQRAVRHVVGNLSVKHSGPQGLVSAIRSCADQAEGDGRPRFDLRLAELQVTKRAHRVLIQVAREAIVNASKYSGASHVRVELAERHAGYAICGSRTMGMVSTQPRSIPRRILVSN